MKKSSERRVFTKEFKDEAVRQCTTGGRSQPEVALSLDTRPGLLGKWVSALRKDGADAFRGNGNRTVEENELWTLKQENKRLSQELEFLKKVSRYFVRGQE